MAETRNVRRHGPLALVTHAPGADTSGPDLSDSPPEAVGAAADAGTSGEASRADHVHAHGDQAGGTLHASATDSVAGFMSAADKAKLDAILPVDQDPKLYANLLLFAG